MRTMITNFKLIRSALKSLLKTVIKLSLLVLIIGIILVFHVPVLILANLTKKPILLYIDVVCILFALIAVL